MLLWALVGGFCVPTGVLHREHQAVAHRVGAQPGSRDVDRMGHSPTAL